MILSIKLVTNDFYNRVSNEIIQNNQIYKCRLKYTLK
jgi:hypothetical protein